MESRKRQVYGYVARRVEALLHQRDSGSGRAALAELRRGVGHAPGELPRLWGMFLENLPEEMMNTSGTPTRAEWAIYTALTLFALHQQGQANAMHQADISLGEAAAQMVEAPDDCERIWQRLNVVAVSEDMVSMSYYLRSLIQLLKANGVSLDYAQLAADLYDFQHPEQAAKVRLRWGQSFFHQLNVRFMKQGEDNDKEASV